MRYFIIGKRTCTNFNMVTNNHHILRENKNVVQKYPILIFLRYLISVGAGQILQHNIKKQQTMKCPSCNETLLMSDKNGVEIDYCPNCRGIWLDRGELDKIIERSADHYSKRENYDSDYKHSSYDEQGKDHQNRHPSRKKESFLGDLFDF